MKKPLRKRNTKKSSNLASSSYYLGYVEEDESPAAIMAKFEELERIQKANSLNPNQELNEDQMKELFDKTSGFSLEKVVNPEEEDWESNCWWLDDDDEQEEEEEQEGDFFSKHQQSESSSFTEEEEEDSKILELQSPISKTTSSKSQSLSTTTTKKRSLPLSNVSINFAVVDCSSLRKEKRNDEIEVLRLPSPITHTWAHLIRFEGEKDVENDASKCSETNSCQQTVLNASLSTSFSPQIPQFNASQILCLLIDVPNARELQNIPVNDFIEKGFLMIWCNEKHEIFQIFQFAHSFGFKYCENLSWIRMNMRNKLALKPSQFVNECKTTLFMFRKFRDSEMELRHQRNSDCIFDWDRQWSSLLKCEEATESSTESIANITESIANSESITNHAIANHPISNSSHPIANSNLRFLSQKPSHVYLTIETLIPIKDHHHHHHNQPQMPVFIEILSKSHFPPNALHKNLPAKSFSNKWKRIFLP